MSFLRFVHTLFRIGRFLLFSVQFRRYIHISNVSVDYSLIFRMSGLQKKKIRETIDPAEEDYTIHLYSSCLIANRQITDEHRNFMYIVRFVIRISYNNCCLRYIIKFYNNFIRLCSRFISANTKQLLSLFVYLPPLSVYN